MTEQFAKTREDPTHSLAPIQIEGTSLEEDIAALSRGRGTRLLASALCAGLAAFAVVVGMEKIDGTRAYGAAAERLEAINAQQANVFIHCALPGLQRSQVSSEDSLHTAIEVISERLQKQYGQQLERCGSSLDGLEVQLAALTVPRDARPRLESLRKATSELNFAVAGYRHYLLDPAQSYDFVQATPRIEKIAIAWSDYETRRGELTSALRRFN
jgi:hypothetical protein